MSLMMILSLDDDVGYVTQSGRMSLRKVRSHDDYVGR